MQKAIARIRIVGPDIVSPLSRFRLAVDLKTGSKRPAAMVRAGNFAESTVIFVSFAAAFTTKVMQSRSYRGLNALSGSVVKACRGKLASIESFAIPKNYAPSNLSARLTLAMWALLIAGTAEASPRQGQLDIEHFALRFSAEFNDEQDLNEKFINHFRRWGNLRTLTGNEEQQLYVDRTYLDAVDLGDVAAPFEVRDGNLEIIAQPTPESARERIDLPYISGLVTTEESFAQTYGYFEIRCRMPAGQGLWPAFWLVGLTHDDALAIEIDIFEMLGHEPERIYHSIHTNDLGIEWGKESGGLDPTAGFNTYGVDWQKDYVDFYVNRERIARAEVSLPGPAYMIANLAVGGNWGGNPDETTEFPARLLIDYIRAYERIDP
ncbi:glycoside hydrolase family 16 protein [Fulvimarina sp. MAC3]|uniref:glycoside hydrolase family 16 protein n=1 Tax=Fulvimarina sp. MAC3 TaxID=3148887 RepID=UPI0031FE0B72